MGILRKITDEYFGDSMRDEDYVKFNTSKTVPVDMGGSVLWADRDLEVESGGDFKFNKYFQGIDIIETKFKDGWRLPTVDECMELFNNGVIRKRQWAHGDKQEEIWFIFNENKLVFDTIGYCYKLKNGNYVEMTAEEVFIRWTSESDKDGEIYIFYCECSRDSVEQIKTSKKWCKSDKDTDTYFPVRLVKDKK